MALRVMSMAEMRLEVLLEAARSGETVSEVCRRFGISRKTYYVYLGRYQAEGVEGLEPRSRVPLHQPGRMPGDVELEICRLRKDHPKWGARRIRAELTRAGVAAPAVSSIHQALVRNYLVALQPKRPRKADRRFERGFLAVAGAAMWLPYGLVHRFVFTRYFTLAVPFGALAIAATVGYRARRRS